jgi:hypothetical protein
MESTDALKTVFRDTAASLTGSTRRRFMARVVRQLGPGGQRRAERELGWWRVTIGKGMHELTSGFTCVPAFSARGRKRAEDRLPHLLEDIQAVVDGQSHADPRVRTHRLSTRLSAAEVRRQLIARKGYTDAALPTAEIIRVKLNAVGETLTPVATTQPHTRSRTPIRPETHLLNTLHGPRVTMCLQAPGVSQWA